MSRMWFINEDGGVYNYDADTQADAFPDDYHVAYETMLEAWDAAEDLCPWISVDEDDDEDEEYFDEGYSQSGEQYMADYLNSDSNIAHLNGY